MNLPTLDDCARIAASDVRTAARVNAACPVCFRHHGDGFIPAPPGPMTIIAKMTHGGTTSVVIDREDDWLVEALKPHASRILVDGVEVLGRD